jgi:hypothetical protein
MCNMYRNCRKIVKTLQQIRNTLWKEKNHDECVCVRWRWREYC